jgi:hypothetical protein
MTASLRSKRPALSTLPDEAQNRSVLPLQGRADDISTHYGRGYYHFVRPHRSLRVACAAPVVPAQHHRRHRYRARTPAMAAGLTTRRWTVAELLAVPQVPERD